MRLGGQRTAAAAPVMGDAEEFLSGLRAGRPSLPGIIGDECEG
jgi:hypothetical protein